MFTLVFDVMVYRLCGTYIVSFKFRGKGNDFLLHDEVKVSVRVLNSLFFSQTSVNRGAEKLRQVM